MTDLDLADDIMLVSDDAINSQKRRYSVDIMKINRAKTELFYWYNKSNQRLQVFRIGLECSAYGRAALTQVI
jgi:hypothetical protein